MDIRKEYLDIALYDLKVELASFKEDIHLHTSNELGGQVFKVELIIEELMTNSFNHLLPSDSAINVSFIISKDLTEITYAEYPVSDLNVEDVIDNAKEKTMESPLQEIGGLGLLLVESFSENIDYRYDLDNRRRTFILKI
ncbi:ATP-binding protein [Vibrio profundum]|uniref:ATP-binding protein n=1 Tax=Vibrio profundum TaxID=2910247 RepID=UPI003D0B1A87